MNNYKKDSKQLFCVKDVFATNKSDEYECRFDIKNFSCLRGSVSVGESLESEEFSLLFPNSIGESKWKLLIYPNGQYIYEKAGASVAIYLVMLCCEKEDDALTANVSFQLKSQNHLGDGPIRKSKAEFIFSIPSKRWIGEPEFAGKNWLKSKRAERFFADGTDTLNISLVVGEISEQNDQIEMESMSSGSKKANSESGSLYDQLFPTKNVSERCESDDSQEKNSEWCKVSYGRGKKKPGNHGNIDSSAKPKSSVQAIILIKIYSKV